MRGFDGERTSGHIKPTHFRHTAALDARRRSPHNGIVGREQSEEMIAVKVTRATTAVCFTTEPRPLTELLAEQGIDAPQGWDFYADPDWLDDEAAARYLEAVRATPTTA